MRRYPSSFPHSGSCIFLGPCKQESRGAEILQNVKARADSYVSRNLVRHLPKCFRPRSMKAEPRNLQSGAYSLRGCDPNTFRFKEHFGMLLPGMVFSSEYDVLIPCTARGGWGMSFLEASPCGKEFAPQAGECHNPACHETQALKHKLYEQNMFLRFSCLSRGYCKTTSCIILHSG